MPNFNAATAGRLKPIRTRQLAPRRLIASADDERVLVVAIHENGHSLSVSQRDLHRSWNWWIELHADETEDRITPTPAEEATR